MEREMSKNTKKMRTILKNVIKHTKENRTREHQKNCECCLSVPVSLSGRRREKARDGGRQEDKQKGRKDRETGRQKGKNTIENELRLTKQKIETEKDSSEK